MVENGAKLLLDCLKCGHVPILHKCTEKPVIEDGEHLIEVSNVHHECPKCGAKQTWKDPLKSNERILLPKRDAKEELRIVREDGY